MNGRNCILAVLPALAISACATIGVNYTNTSPTKAITAIANEYDKTPVSVIANPNGTIIQLPKEAADKTLKAIPDYCRVRGGRIFSWNGGTGLACIDNQSNQETFAVKLNGVVFGVTSLDIAERTAENDSFFDLYLQGWGYTTLTEKRRQQVQAIEAEGERQRLTKERLRDQRIRERDKVAYRGAQVCQDAEYLNRRILLVGTVEQVEGDRIKVFVERAVFPGAPGLSPGGFQQHYGWVNIWDVAPCG